MPDWGEIFADPAMQAIPPNPELLGLLPVWKQAGCRHALDAGCGAGRHVLALAQEGFRVWGLDREAEVLQGLKTRLAAAGLHACLALADLEALPFPDGAFDLVITINAITHGYTRTFQAYCGELDRVLRAGGHLFIYVSPREAGELVRLPHTRELEPGTLVDIDTPDGNLVHHLPTPDELRDRFPGYRVHRFETIQAPIPFMGNVTRPQLILWGEKG